LKILLDTHVVLWGYNEPSRLSAAVVEMIRSPAVTCLVSTVTVWEAAIKSRTGKLTIEGNFLDVLRGTRDYDLLDVTAEHMWRVRDLPALHGDPFDRLLIAQALAEGATLVTHDHLIQQYSVPVMRP
jgi:PIN domain nuclease of toxin-antitoxin system